MHASIHAHSQPIHASNYSSSFNCTILLLIFGISGNIIVTYIVCITSRLLSSNSWTRHASVVMYSFSLGCGLSAVSLTHRVLVGRTTLLTQYFSLLLQKCYQFSRYGLFKKTASCGALYIYYLFYKYDFYTDVPGHYIYTMYKLITLWLNPFIES